MTTTTKEALKEFDPLVSEMRSVLANNPDACDETKALLELAIEVQSGKPLNLINLREALRPCSKPTALDKEPTRVDNPPVA